MLRLMRRGWAVNQPTLAPTPSLTRLAVINEGIANFVAGTLGQGLRPISIAGDCCAAIGVVTGLQRAGLKPRVLWLDAHGDFNTPETSPSGFLAGMALAMLVGRGELTLPSRLGADTVNESDVVLCDARDLDPLERTALQSSRVLHLPSVDRLDTVDFGADPVYVHFDCDILDPGEAPAMLYPTPGGPRLIALQTALRRVALRARIVAVSLTTWALDRDESGETERAVNQALEAALGEPAQAPVRSKT